MNALKTKSSVTNLIKSMTVAAVLATGLLIAPMSALAGNGHDNGKAYKNGSYKEHVVTSKGRYGEHKKQFKKANHAQNERGQKKHHRHDKYKKHYAYDKHAHKKHRRSLYNKHSHSKHSHGKHNHRHNTRVIRTYDHHDHAYNHHHGYDPRISLGLHLGHFDLYFED